ncbi:MAG: Sua5/YciO/YrdC/YwlC family protein, partial [Clostridia bacterium]|nr:Sua5/YciO/YrdC/YwlC family protein [Clostridia bacterium]
GRPSPTKAQDVFSDMDGRLPLIIDGGECFAGVESTVLSLLEETPVLLRPGYVTKEEMEKVLGKEIILSGAILDKVKEGETVRSPGMKYKHYSPDADITVVDGDFESFKNFVNAHNDKGTFALCFSGEEKLLSVPSVTYGKEEDGAEQAQLLFTALRELDRAGAVTVYARCPQKTGVSLAVYNRLIRSAGFKFIKL